MERRAVILRLVDVPKINISLSHRALALANENKALLNTTRSNAIEAAIVNLNVSLKRGEKVSLTLPTETPTPEPRSA
jgi:hypothetical protein